MMNKETAIRTSETVVVTDPGRRKRIIIISLAVLAVVLAAVLFMTLGKKEAAAGGPAGAGGPGGGQVPTVTVVVPGRQTVSRSISATGTLAARVDMPVGIAGEGGQVAQVLVQPGQWVGAGQTLAVIERSVQTQEAAQLAANIRVARADAALAENELARAQSLVSRGFVSRADVDRRLAARDAARARVAVAQASYNASRARIGRLDIRAPAAGLVLERRVEPGQVVGGGSGALFRIARGGEMELKAQLSENDLANLRVGVPAIVTPAGTTQNFNGSVWQVSPVIDQQNRQGVARVALAYNPALRPGGFASVQIVAGAQQAPVLPESAMQTDDNGTFVYVVDATNKVQRRKVETGIVTPRGIAIVAGLTGQESVVLRAGGFLNPGEKVRPQRQKI
jgi:RND family efflux transporter MFP subunit